MLIRQNPFAILIVGLLLLAAVPSTVSAEEPPANATDQPEYRTWTNRSGKYQIEAVFVELKDGKVTLKKKDGKTIKVPLDSLSDADQKYVQQTGKGQPATNPSVTPRKPKGKPAPVSATFTNKRTGETHKGKILDREEVDGVWKYLVESEDGQQAWIVVHQWKITYDKANNNGDVASDESDGQSADPGKATDRSTVEISPSAGVGTKLMSVVVTGVGTDPDKAKYNALSNAVEQTVGVLVDAETLVENDKLVRDKVLTYTEGDVTAIKVLDQSQKDGLYYVRLKATVAVQKIESRLRSQHVAVREVDGEVFYDNAKRRQENAKNFTEMLGNALRDFGAEKLVKPSIVGKPEVVGQNDQFATMLVKVETQPDMENWKNFRADMLRILGNRHRMKSGSFVVQEEGNGDKNTGFYYEELGNARERMKQMDGDVHGHWILLLQGYREGKDADKMRSQWTAYQVDKSIAPVFAELQNQKYRLHVRLLGKTDNVLAEDERVLNERMHSSWADYPYSSLSHDDGGWSHQYDAYFLSPFLWDKGSYCPAMPAQEFRISVPVNDLSDVARVTAKIEPIKEPQK